MRRRSPNARINVKLLVFLILVTTAVGISLVAARQIRRSILSKVSLEAGQAAFAQGDWPAACKNLQEYLGRNPDDVEILKKYAQAHLSIRPLESGHVAAAVSAYRRVLQLAPLDEVAYAQLATLYPHVGDFESLAHIARMRIERTPEDPNDRKAANDWKAPLWLADALVQLNKPQDAQQVLRKLLGELESLSDRHVEYVKACVRMHQLTAGESADAKRTAWQWLNKAVDYDPNSRTCVEARVCRAQFYRQTKAIPGVDDKARISLARDDLNQADSLGTDDARIRYLLGQEWLVLGELDRAEAELQTIDGLSAETIERGFFDMDTWRATRFRLAAELAIRRAAMTEALSLADGTLAALAEKRHRILILPSALSLYLAAGEGAKTDAEKAEAVRKARKCLDEYLDLVRGQQTASASPVALAWLQASVETAENKPYAVIDTLRPVAVSMSADPDMGRIWRLLGEAYRRTNQPAQAANALQEYLQVSQRLGVDAQDPQTLQAWRGLAQQYALSRNWKKAFEAAQTAESVGATDLATKLCRIEAGIHLATSEGKVDAARLRDLAKELDDLRGARPKEVDIRVLRAGLAAVLNQSQEAEEQLKLAIAECNEPLRAEMQLAGFYFRTQRRPEAIRLCAAACQRHPGVAEPWLILSEIQAADANDPAARQSLQQGLGAVTDRHEKRSLLTRLAWLDLTRGDRSAGIRLLKDLAAEDANDLQVRALLLETREIQQDPAGAQTLVDELRRGEGQSGRWWRLYQAVLWLSSDTWASRQQEIANLLRYCLEADPQWSAPALVLARMYERLGDMARAEDVYRQALARNPSATGVANGLLALLARQERFADAKRTLQQIRMTPQAVSAWQINMALRAGDYSEAMDELRLRVAGDSQDADSRIALAQIIYRQKKDSRQALQYLKEAEALTTNARVQASATAARASILKAEGQTEEARRLLDDYAARRNNFYAYWIRAAFLREEGRLEQAEADYRKLTTFPEQGAFGYRELANFYAETRRLDQAIATLEAGAQAYPADRTLSLKLMLGRAQQNLAAANALPDSEKETRAKLKKDAQDKLEEIIKLEPTAINAHLTLINLALQDEQYQAARDHAIRALASNADDPALLSARARAELALGNVRSAADAARLALQKDPNNVALARLFTQAALASGDRGLLGEAIQRLEQAVNLSPTSVDARLDLASTHYRTGDVERAEKIYRGVLEQHPDSIRALNDLAWILQEHNHHFDEALKLADKALTLAPNDLNLLDTRGTILAQLPERLADARSDFAKLVELSPPDSPRQAKALLQLGRVCLKLKDLPQAKQSVEKALQIHQKTPVLTRDEQAEIAEITSKTEI